MRMRWLMDFPSGKEIHSGVATLVTTIHLTLNSVQNQRCNRAGGENNLSWFRRLSIAVGVTPFAHFGDWPTNRGCIDFGRFRWMPTRIGETDRCRNGVPSKVRLTGQIKNPESMSFGTEPDGRSGPVQIRVLAPGREMTPVTPNCVPKSVF